MSVKISDYYKLNKDLSILTGDSGFERNLTGILLLDYELSKKSWNR